MSKMENKVDKLISSIESMEPGVDINEVVASKKVQELLRLVVNMFKVRGITLNKTEQEKVVMQIAKAVA